MWNGDSNLLSVGSQAEKNEFLKLLFIVLTSSPKINGPVNIHMQYFYNNLLFILV